MLITVVEVQALGQVHIHNCFGGSLPSIPSPDESTECPFVSSVRAVEVSSMEAFTEASVEVNSLPQPLSRNLEWQ